MLKKVISKGWTQATSRVQAVAQLFSPLAEIVVAQNDGAVIPSKSGLYG